MERGMRRISRMSAPPIALAAVMFGTFLVTIGVSVAPVGANGEPDPRRPPAAEARFRYALERVHGRPGRTVRIPLRVRSDAPLTMVCWSLEFDPEVVVFRGVRLADPIRLILERLRRVEEIDGRFEVFASQEEGWVQASLVFDFEGREFFALPPNLPVPLATIEFLVRPDAPAGVYHLPFTQPETARYQGNFRDRHGPVFNRCRSIGRRFDRESRFDGDEVHRPETEGADLRVSIIGDVGIFVRGDSNLDLEVDIADPVTILDYLFLGGGLDCPEAADANRDHEIDLSDPIMILDYLFMGSSRWRPTTEPATESASGLGCSL